MRRLPPLACAAVILLTGCSGEPSTLDVGEVRQAVEGAAESPEDCPLLDVPAALAETGVEDEVTLSSASAGVSENAEPPADALAAQTEDGMSPVQVAAGSVVDCEFMVGGEEFGVHLGTSINDEFVALSLFVARVQSLDDSFAGDPEGLVAFVDGVGPGEVASVPNGTAVLRNLEVQGHGSAALLVSSATLEADALLDVSAALAEDLGAR